MTKVIRHGDLLLVPNGEIPEGKLNPKKDNCVLDGEVTWHHHRVGAWATVELLEGEQTEDNSYFRGVVTVKRGKPVKITHEEHNEIELKPLIMLLKVSLRRTWIITIEHKRIP